MNAAGFAEEIETRHCESRALLSEKRRPKIEILGNSSMKLSPFFKKKIAVKRENIITKRLDYKPETFNFKFISGVTILKQRDTNFVHTLFPCQFTQVLIESSTASCFESQRNS